MSIKNKGNYSGSRFKVRKRWKLNVLKILRLGNVTSQKAKVLQNIKYLKLVFKCTV